MSTAAASSVGARSGSGGHASRAAMRQAADRTPRDPHPDSFWRAFANPWRRKILDELKPGPKTTGELAERLPDISRFAVMQHLDVLSDAGVVIVERRGRHRYNHINSAALRTFYERWVNRYADAAAMEMTSLKRHLEEATMAIDDKKVDAFEAVRVLRLENEMRFTARPERVFRVMTDPDEILKWFPYTYGEARTKRIVFEPRVGGAQYEDWGDGAGHYYGLVTSWDPPRGYSVRSKLHAGTIMDTTATIETVDGGSVLRSSRVIVGPIDEEQERGIRFHGDMARFEEAIRKVVEGG